MAVIDRIELLAITSETQRIVDVAKNLWGLQSLLAPNQDAVVQLEHQITALLDSATKISEAVINIRNQ